ncbi:uncharacterized protein F5891DRAFT_984336 [Suillus fuscotomentosus]|uniref:Uncharacterized protein n=1 Tax=Suillus fuscotomentosus TaxID=1912939 RepID=A0AAD4DW80_9AGAM|nr:uncharacterized protein F5891DRAFT_984336 [Suillus fuscotomentosus]KAG1895254.1 hypothetical protein F5891DRAFT_984336 [Suillus fuscotomentosus]
MKIERGIGEVCRWFKMLLNYYCMLHTKTHTMDSWSSMMMANIRKDLHFIDYRHNNPREDKEWPQKLELGDGIQKTHDAPHKFVGYMMSMSCVCSTSNPTSLLSADVACSLIEVIKVYTWHYQLFPAVTLVYI